jgi:[glutamine synthetase] adenylyltransferase / [glutamine synthetase]-adenylyl-L-tyrosine phosphorylase
MSVSKVVAEHDKLIGDRLRAELLQRLPSLESLADDAWPLLARLAEASPLYERLLLQFPGWAAWLTERRVHREEFTPRFIRELFEETSQTPGDVASQAERLAALRTFRRRMSMHVAYREVNSLCSPAATLVELSLLAELCIEECLAMATARVTSTWGVPWDEDAKRPAKFCVLALGKLGGLELNFSSDIDLIFVYEGDGHGMKEGAQTSAANPEIFARIAETTVRSLQTTAPEGFLFRVDLRLRPEGEFGPIVSSLSALENYYSSSGQTWERLALIKARPVAGNKGLGEELLESVQSFRYPRHPPPSVLQEVAAMKARTELEIVGSEALQRDIKSGYGGIREIEFRVQSLQLINAGRYPFLQTGSTVAALTQLARYELLPVDESKFLEEAYWFLRAVEHRVQMREERQTHQLPAGPEELCAIAHSLGFADADAFRERLDEVRERVHDGFEQWFQGGDEFDEFNHWWIFLTTGKPDAEVTARIDRWFRSAPESAAEVRLFALGNLSHPVTRELVSRFIDLAKSLDAVIPGLARPAGTLRRLARFAETYGTRQQFFNACAMNPELLRVIATLFDRSEFIFEVLRLHPEILEEVLRPEILRKKNDREILLEELAAGAAAPDPADWLWHYVRAEQIRLAIGALLRFSDPVAVEHDLTLLADTVLEHLLARHDPEARLAVVALGKFGGRELTQGSDLDIMVLSSAAETAGDEPVLRALQKDLTHRGPLGSTFELDLRLRPHGDAGPRIVTLDALEGYFRSGAAQDWEMQLLTRARVVAGNTEVAARFLAWRDRLLYTAPPTPEQEKRLWAMRMRVERERDRSDPPERALKSGPGGLIDIEFLAQLLQLRHGTAIPALRKTSTREVLDCLIANAIINRTSGARLADNHEFLRRIERNLRRDTSRPASVIDTGEPMGTLATWLGFPGPEEFWVEHVRRMGETRRLVLQILGFNNLAGAEGVPAS